MVKPEAALLAGTLLAAACLPCAAGKDAAKAAGLDSSAVTAPAPSLETGFLPDTLPGKNISLTTPAVDNKTISVKTDYKFSGYLSAWTQDCSAETCRPPVPAAVNKPVSFILSPVNQPGTFRSVQRRETFSISGKVLQADISVFTVCPAYSPVTNGICELMYFQAQAEVSGAAQAYCTGSLNTADAIPFPVMTCAGKALGDNTLKLGITRHRFPFGKTGN